MHDPVDEPAGRISGKRKSYPHTSFYAPPDLLRRLGDVARTLGVTSSQLLARCVERLLLEYPLVADLPDAERHVGKVASAKAWLDAAEAERARASLAYAKAEAAVTAYLLAEAEKVGWRKGDVAGAKIFNDALVNAAEDVLQRSKKPMSAPQISDALPPSLKERFKAAGHPLSGPSVDAVLRERAKRGKHLRKQDGLYSCIDARIHPRPKSAPRKRRPQGAPREVADLATAPAASAS